MTNWDFNPCHPERSVAMNLARFHNDRRGVEGSRQSVLRHADSGSSNQELSPHFFRSRHNTDEHSQENSLLLHGKVDIVGTLRLRAHQRRVQRRDRGASLRMTEGKSVLKDRSIHKQDTRLNTNN
jgi:hypothetical protein